MENIEKIFYDDVRTKKKIGRGVHYRTGKGSDRAGVAGGVRFAKNNFKRGEKNSAVNITNMYYDIIPYKELKQKDKDMQKQLITGYLENFSKAHIIREMKTSSITLNKLIDELKIEMPEGDPSLIDRSGKMNINEAKRFVIPKDKFYSFDNADRYEILHYYNKRLRKSSKDIGEKWDIDPSSLGTMKSKWKKDWQEKYPNKSEKEIFDIPELESEQEEQNNNDNSNQQPVIDEFMILEDEDIPNQEQIDSIDKEESQGKELVSEYLKREKPAGYKPEIRSKEESPLKIDSSSVFNITGVYDGQNLIDKLTNIRGLLESNSNYEINVNISKKSDSKREDINHTLEEIMKYLQKENK